jgi:hypothetical protein
LRHIWSDVDPDHGWGGRRMICKILGGRLDAVAGILFPESLENCARKRPRDDEVFDRKQFLTP